MDTIKLIKNLIKEKSITKDKGLHAGNVVMFQYNPKDKSQPFDRTPLCLVLRKSASYTIGINFHWCPIPMRKILLGFIFKLNKKNVKENKPLEISWAHIKPFLFKTGYAPIIRIYINKRISHKLIKIPNYHLKQVIETKSADFIGADENKLYVKALRQSRASKKTKI